MAEILISPQDVRDWLGTTRPADLGQVVLCAAAIEAWVNANTDESMAPDTSRYLGGIMLAARLYARRGSTTGVQTFESLGISYVSKYDPDVSRLLGLDTVVVG